MIVFSAISAYFPGMLGYLIIAYLLIFFAIQAIVVGKYTKSMLSDLNYISSGKILLKEDKKTIQKLQAKDPSYEKMLRKQATSMLIQLGLMILILIVLAYSPVRLLIPQLILSIQPSITDERLLLFISNMVLFLTLFLVSAIILPRAMGQSPMQIVIPSTYKVTEKGMILDERLPLKFPLKINKLEVNSKMKYIELVVKQDITPSTAGKGEITIRLYSTKPKVLLEIIEKNSAKTSS